VIILVQDRIVPRLTFRRGSGDVARSHATISPARKSCSIRSSLSSLRNRARSSLIRTSHHIIPRPVSWGPAKPFSTTRQIGRPWKEPPSYGKIIIVKTELQEILEKVYEKKLSPQEAFARLKDYPYQDLGFAKIDHHREVRRGFPEIIYGQGKSDDQIIKIAREICRRGNSLLITRVESGVYAELKKKIPGCLYNSLGKTAYLKKKRPLPGKGKIVIITAGTSDIPVAEEAAVTCEMLGNEVDRIYDVGVAGLHRLLGEMEKIKMARLIIAVAGMEGALPSVVAGLVKVPVVAVPTSVGYGASFQGISALLAMLNSCPGGVAVVNIDNGFGAGYLASLINHL